MNKVRTSIANRKYKKAPNWSDPADKYNNWTKKHTVERFNSRLDGVEDWLVRSPKQSIKKEKKKNFKKWSELKGP